MKKIIILFVILQLFVSCDETFTSSSNSGALSINRLIWTVDGKACLSWYGDSNAQLYGNDALIEVEKISSNSCSFDYDNTVSYKLVSGNTVLNIESQLTIDSEMKITNFTVVHDNNSILTSTLYPTSIDESQEYISQRNHYDKNPMPERLWNITWDVEGNGTKQLLRIEQDDKLRAYTGPNNFQYTYQLFIYKDIEENLENAPIWKIFTNGSDATKTKIKIFLCVFNDDYTIRGNVQTYEIERNVLTPFI